MCPSRQYSSTIYLGDMVQRGKTNIFDDINEM